MPVMILAAGQNTRFKTGKPKTLLELQGVTLLEHHIKKFSKLGLNRFLVITGFYKTEVEQFVPDLASKYQVDIDCLFNDEFNLPNGRSVYTGKEYLSKHQEKGFILIMGDHYFSENLLVNFIKQLAYADLSNLYLLTDTPGLHNLHIDVDDVTKVQVDAEANILGIGKTLTDFQLYDTGLFYMPMAAFEAYQKAAKLNQHSISDIVVQFAEQKKAKVLHGNRSFWADVDTATDFESVSKQINA